MRRMLFWTAVLVSLAALAGGGLYAYAGYRSTPSPQDVVSGYFAALARADAPAALGYGTVPDGPHDLLTGAVLAQQQHIAPIRDVRVVAVQRAGSRASVSVTYRLGFARGGQADSGTVDLTHGRDGWRLAQVAVPTRLRLTQAVDRVTVAGSAVPSGPVLLFPGALPVRFDTPYLSLTATSSAVRFGAPATTVLHVEPSSAARAAFAARLGAAVRACVSGPRPSADCPLPSPRYVPGSLHGRIVGSVMRQVRLTVTPADAGMITATGTVQFEGSYQRLAYDNVAQTHRGTLSLPITASAYAVAPLALRSVGTTFAPAADAATPGAPAAPEYYFDQWHVPQLWAAGARGQGVTIAEIDTGVDAGLPVFAGRVLAGTDFGSLGGDGQVDRDESPYGHGTSMASIMVGRPGEFGIEGLAPGAAVLPVAVPIAGTTDASSVDHLPNAIRWAADHGAKIISMSLGGVRRPAQNRTACPYQEQQAIFYALRKGAVVFAASGNRGEQDDAVEEPSVCLGVVSVGAVDSSGTVAAFSSRHRYLTLTAPGVNVASIGHNGAAYAGDGTSQATAVASAVAALVWSKYPQLSASQVVARLIATADPHGDAHSPAYGYGTVDAFRAVTADVPADAPDPVSEAAAPFMARRAAVAPPAPPPVSRAARPPGTYVVGAAPPSTRRAHMVIGSAVALAGLASLLVFVAVGRRGRRQRRRPAPPFATVLDA
jgi:subtilisin family serine protease